jgi:hypothetical protein
MENDILVKFDALCYAAFLNINHLTKESNRIALKNVDWSNKEHKFLIHIVNACYSLLGEKEVAVDTSPMTRRAIARECGALGKIKKMDKNEQIFVNVPEVLEFMRGAACETCGSGFTFGQIYDEYYAEGK